MLKLIGAVAFAMTLAAPAFAQKTDLPDRDPKRLSDYDLTVWKAANATLKLNGMCTAQYVIGADSRLKDVAIDCTHPEMAPYVLATMETATWQSEILDKDFIDSLPKRERFAYGTGAPAVDPRGEKSPALDVGIDRKALDRAMSQVDQEGLCNVLYTVGADGKPKDIVPNCTPEAFNEGVTAAIAKMKFIPGQKDGQPTDWPGMSMPLKLAKPE